MRYGLRSLGLRNFRLYWLAGLFMTGVQGITQLALAWLILDLTGKVGQLGLVIFIQGIAWTFVALAGGIIADSYSRRGLMIVTQFFVFLSMAALGALALAGVVQSWQVYLASFMLGATQALTMPARQAYVRNLVTEDYMMNAVALNSMQMQAGRIIWPSLAGVVIGAVGVGWSLALGAACSVLAIGLLLVITGVVEDEHFKREPALTQIVGGVRYAFSTPVLKMVQLLNIAVAFFGLAYISMGPGFGREELHLNASGTGFFIMASGVGAIVAALVLVMHEVNDRNRAVCLMCGAFGASLLAICLSPNVATAFAFMAVFGFSNSCFSILAQTIFQLSAEPRYLGRVIGLWSMGGGVGQLTALPIGVAGDAFGLRWSLGFVAVMLVLSSAAVAALLLPRIRLRAAPALANAAT